MRLQPFAQTDYDVEVNFGSVGQLTDSAIGINGLYGLYADAVRTAAQKEGVLPREMQSITWEATRALLNENIKDDTLKAQIFDVWREYAAKGGGKQHAQEARNAIEKLITERNQKAKIADSAWEAPDWLNKTPIEYPRPAGRGPRPAPGRNAPTHGQKGDTGQPRQLHQRSRDRDASAARTRSGDPGVPATGRVIPGGSEAWGGTLLQSINRVKGGR